MAKILNKDPEVYNRERDAFMRELHHFHDTRGTKFRRSPAITGREVDLYLLYNLVTARGGWIKVTNRNLWNELIDKFNLPKSCINGGVALKQIYVRYLDRYEKSHYTRDEGDRGNDDDEDNRHKRWSSRAIHTVPLTYNHLQHSIAESMRSHNGLSSDLHKQSDYDKLLLSLVSPLPNEQDFAINICTLLANENKTPLRLDKCPRMIDYLLAHAGVFNHSSLRDLFKESYSNIRGHTLNSFWTDVLRVDSFEDLMNENKFIKLKRKTVLPVLNAFIKRDRGNQAPGPPSSIVKKEEKKEVPATATKDTSEIVESAVVEKIETETSETSNIETKVGSEESASALTSEGSEITNAAGPVDETKVSDETKNNETEVEKSVSEKNENAEDNKDLDVQSSENINESNIDAKSDVVKGAKDSNSNIESEVKDSLSTDVKNETVEDPKDSLSSAVRSEKVDDSKDDLSSDLRSEKVSDSKGSLNSDLRTDTQDSLGSDVRNASEVKGSLDSRSEIGNETKDSSNASSVTPKEEFSEPQPCCSKDIPPNFIDVDNEPKAINENEVPKTIECPVTTNDSSDDSDLFAPSDEDSSSGKQKFKLKIEPSDHDLFDLGRTLGTQEYVGQRVMQIANILRNLSFVEENVSVLANNITFLRFLLLCVSSRWNSLHQCGFDTLTNIAAELLVKDPIRDRLTECLMYTVTQGLASEDRFVIISSLDILNKLSQNEANEDVLIRYLEQNVYEQVCVYLTVHDIMMLVYTLECLYSLSSLGERSCNSISRVHGIYDVLVALVTVEAQSYGQKACISMKVVETVPPGGTPILIPPQSTISQPTTLTSPTYTNLCSNSTNLMTSISMPAPLQPQMTPTIVPQPPKSPIPISTQTVTNVRTITSFAPIRTTNVQQIQQISNVQMPTVVQVQQPPIIAQPPVSVPQPAQPQQSVNINPLQAQAQSSQQLVQQQHAHQQAIQENEQFALTWLRATCEPDMVGKIEQQELYKNYLNSCAKIGRRGVIAPLHFPRIVRSVFGGTVGPNPSKTEPNMQYYDGIKMRAKPLIIATPQPVTTQPTVLTTVKTTSRRTKTPTIVSSISSIESTINEVATPPQSPASPILKAQLSAPAKKESPVKTNETTKNQASTHPHLSQALMGAAVPTSNAASPVTASATGGGGSTTTTTTVAPCSGANTAAQAQSSSSLIKSLLATKVNECMLTGGGSMKPATATVITSDCAPAVATQVAQRQQRLLAAQQNPVVPTPQQPATQTKCAQKPKETARINGARPQDAELVDSLVTSSTASDNRTSPQSLMRGRQAPPPLAPLSAIPKQSKMDTDDSDSVGNSSVASSSGIATSHITVGPDNITDDGDNSLTSFESLLLNGIPNSIDIDAPCNDDVSVSPRPPKTKTQSLMLADLLEKKIDKKDPPLINGLLCRELRIGDKGLELVENHIEKVLNEIPNNQDGQVSVIVSSDACETNRAVDPVANNTDSAKMEEQIDTEAMEVDSVVSPLKRPAEEQLPAEAKRPHLSSVIVSNSNVNGTASREISPNKETVVKDENVTNNSDDNEIGNVSSTAANLYAALAADALEDEDDLIQPQEEIKQEQPQFVQVVQAGKSSQQQQPQQQQQLIVHAPRQIIVSQAQIGTTGQVLFTAGGQIIQQGGSAATATIKTPVGHQTLPVLVQAGQNASQQRVVLQQVMQHPTGGVQLVASGGQPGQYVISSGGAQGQTTYMMAQPQTAIVQGQPQTVLVAQTGQHQVSGAKTIIILQSQTAAPPQATHHQKVVVTPQGQQVVVTQVPRPVLQSSAISSVVPQPPSLMAPNVSKNPTVQQQTVITSNSSNVIKCTQPSTSAAFSAVTSTQCNVKTIVTTAVIGNTCNTATKMNVSSPGSVLNKDNKLNTFSVNTKIETPVSTSAKTPRNTGKTTLKQLNATESLFICEWKDCKMKDFKNASEVLIHAVKAHCPECETEIQCLWERCDNMKRKRLSLMTHLMDRHCNTEAMKQSAVRRKQLSLSGRTEVTAPPPPTPHPGYAPDAALHAIKRHALEFVNPKELMQQRADKQPPAAPVPAPQIGTTSATDQDENEGPVTKSIRLTASLILRNLVIYANNSRRYLRHYESHLASIALSNVESSRTIAQVLYDMNDSGGHR